MMLRESRVRAEKYRDKMDNPPDGFFRTEKTPWEIAVGVIGVYAKEFGVKEVGSKNDAYGLDINGCIIAFGKTDSGMGIKEVYDKKSELPPEATSARLSLINKIEELTGVEIK